MDSNGGINSVFAAIKSSVENKERCPSLQAPAIALLSQPD